MGDTIKFTEIDRPTLTTAEELERIAMEQEDAELNKVFDKALDKAFDEAVKRHSAMLHEEVFAILRPVFDALFDQAIERHRGMLSNEAEDAAIEATGLTPCWDSQGRFMGKMSEPTQEQ